MNVLIQRHVNVLIVFKPYSSKVTKMVFMLEVTRSLEVTVHKLHSTSIFTLSLLFYFMYYVAEGALVNLVR